MDVTVACSPDADDLFMMRALMDGRIDTGEYRFSVVPSDTDALNRMATGAGPHVTAMSFAWYPKINAHYALLSHGGSFGEGYGPVVVAKSAMKPESLAGHRVAVPGTTTTAYAVLRMIVPGIEPVVTPITPYARIFEALRAGEVDAGLVIHEGRLTYEAEGFVRVCEIGEWWKAQTGLPLPLGGNAIRRDLGEKATRDISRLVKASIADALANRDEAIVWLMERGTALETADLVDRYLGMYANARTLDCGEDGKRGVKELMRRIGFDGAVDFVD